MGVICAELAVGNWAVHFWVIVKVETIVLNIKYLKMKAVPFYLSNCDFWQLRRKDIFVDVGGGDEQ